MDINKDDLILDNGACFQIITKKVGIGLNEYIPVMSKRLFNDLKRLNLIFTSTELKHMAEEMYKLNQVTFWKFNIDAMQKLGY